MSTSPPTPPSAPVDPPPLAAPHLGEPHSGGPWPPVEKKEIFGWAMFDFANSSYTTLIVTVAFSVYFTKLVAPGVRADALWGIGLTVSNLLTVLLAPVIGAVADDTGRKKNFLFATYALCVGGTLALWWVRPADPELGLAGSVVLGLVLFILSNLGFLLGENLVAAFLPEISTPDNVGRISGYGWGLGYLGGLLCLGATFPLLRGGFELANQPSLRLAWVVTGLFFLVSGIPTFVLLRERAPRGPTRSLSQYLAVSFGRLATTARAIGHFRELARFLVVFFVYSCGLKAIIAFAAIFAEKTIGFTAVELLVLFAVLQISSTAGAVGFGFVQDRIGARLSLQLSLLLWISVSVGSYYCYSKGLFWAIGVIAGLGIGSLQSMSRAVVGMFTPVDKSGEFFSFWGFADKLSYMIGPLVFGLVSSATGSQRDAILFLVAFFVLGLLGLLLIDEQRGRQAAEAWNGKSAG